MALHNLMHPRNPYKNKRPDFKLLAETYPQFGRHTQIKAKGAVVLDFKDPEALRSLSWTLLRHDFNLDVHLPPDRLVPTVPLRLNYILWLEDMLGEQPAQHTVHVLGEQPAQHTVHGIDIGTGASCVYPLIAARKNGWHFTASEADATSCAFAQQNVDNNKLSQQIKVVKVEETDGLYDLLYGDPSAKYDFSMCNPPFYGSSLEAWGGMSDRNEDRDEPRAVNTASPQESVVLGGEVNFVKRMIDDSVLLKDRVKVYSSMLGKKSSLVPLKEHLKNNGITNYGQTEFCQGRTMRWGLGWSFDSSIIFPKPPSKVVREGIPRPPIVHTIPHKLTSLAGVTYNVPGIGAVIMSLLEDLKVIFEPEKSSADILVLEAIARRNTWSNQRRQRRQKKSMISEEEEQPAKRIKLDPSEDTKDNSNTTGSNCNHDEEGDELDMTLSIEDVSEYLVRWRLTLKRDADDVQLEMAYIEGSKENLHQIMQFFKNKLK